jgi:transcription elongation factor GreA
MAEEHVTTRAKFGDTVVLSDLSSGKESSYTLVDRREANPAKGKLSVASPLGKAILDKQVGQTVEIAAPAGTFCCRIENIVALSTKGKMSLQPEKKLTGADK